MITAATFNDRGLVQVSGAVPNGPALVQRVVDSFPPYTLRGGNLNVALGGLVLEDSEAPLSLPLKYQVTVSPTDRLVQQNLVLTPTMLHGRQGWTPGVNRNMNVVSDPSALSAMVAQVTPNPAGVAGAAPPTVVGSVRPRRRRRGRTRSPRRPRVARRSQTGTGWCWCITRCPPRQPRRCRSCRPGGPWWPTRWTRV